MDAGLKARERYRPWLRLGLRHILLPEDSALTGSYVEPPAAPAPPPRRPARPRPQPTTPAGAVPAQSAHDKPAHDRPVPAADTDKAPDTPPDWSSIWRRYRSKLMVPCRTVWTYYELGLDLGDAPDDTRRELFRRIMQALSWPPGSIGFWPVAFQRRGALEPRRELFLRGLRETGAHTVVCFGAGAHGVLFDNAEFRLETTTMGDATVIVLPGPEDMLGANAAQAKRLVWERLKDYKPA